MASGSANTLQMLFLLTVIALLPSILIMMSSFTRIIIVLSFIRNALGLQQTPPNQVLVGIALFLTLFIMSPTIDQINKTAYQPLINNQITTQQAYTNAMEPLRDFMFRQTENSSLNTFINRCNTSHDGDLCPRSSLPRYCTLISIVSAKDSRVYPLRNRSRFIRSPRVITMAPSSRGRRVDTLL
jgi:flagellar biosynthesis protein FliP